MPSADTRLDRVHFVGVSKYKKRAMSSPTVPMITFPLTAETLQAVVRAGLPHAALGMNISKLAADAAVITINADGTATVGIPPAGLSLGAKGGGKRGPRAKKTTLELPSDVSLVEAARLATEPNRVEVLKHREDLRQGIEDGTQV